MVIIQQKLNENKARIKREKYLSASDKEFSDFLAHAEYSSEVSCVKNAVFPLWDNNSGTTTADHKRVTNWNSFTFRTWEELITVLKRFQQVKNYIGWFFMDRDGPYFKISLNAFLSHIPSISDYGIMNDHYNFGWVGDIDNVGVLLGKNPITSSDKKFIVSIWGM